MKRMIILAILTVFIVIGCESALESKYSRLQIGMNKEEVVKIVGEPGKVDSTGLHWIYFNDDLNPAFNLKFSRTKSELKLIEIGMYRK